MSRFLRKPEIVEAVQFTRQTWASGEVQALVGEMLEEVNQTAFEDERGFWLNIPTSEGWLYAEEGNWIVRDSRGAFSLRRESMFALLYEAL